MRSDGKTQRPGNAWIEEKTAKSVSYGAEEESLPHMDLR